ncbi:hypothetical protein C369_04458 [Cryptococcus neoformans A5-35-17]|nr:hypothetical protein C369_04458 [Cryptococcus neoformans var. grubii A5-35-17]
MGREYVSGILATELSEGWRQPAAQQSGSPLGLPSFRALFEFNGRHSSAIGVDQSNCAEDAVCCAYFVDRTNICSQRLLRIRHHSGTPRPVSLHPVILVAMLGPLPPACLGEEMPVRCWPRRLLVARRKGKRSGRLFRLRRGLGGDVCCKYCI